MKDFLSYIEKKEKKMKLEINMNYRILKTKEDYLVEKLYIKKLKENSFEK